MPKKIVKNEQVECKQLQVIIDLSFPPVTVGPDGVVSYGKITHVESKGLDANGNPAGNVYWSHDEIPSSTKAKLVSILLTDLPLMLSQEGISIDLEPKG